MTTVALVAGVALQPVPVGGAGTTAPGDLHLASITPDGVKGNWSIAPSLSADGSRVAFTSGSHLHPADNDDHTDVYVKDVRTGEVFLASASATGEKGNSRSSLAAISADGNRVAFASGATNLHPSGSNGLMVKDLTTGEVLFVASSGEYPVLSADGTRVAFQTSTPGLDPRDNDETSDVYVKDLATGELFLASTSTDGIKANGDFFKGSGGAALSGDGTKVGFASGATNLHPEDPDDDADVYVKDLATGELTLVSTSADGVKADGQSFSPSLSADGSVVALRSYASNLVPGFSGARGQVFVKDLTTGVIRPASVSLSGGGVDWGAADPSLSADGTRVAFNSSGTNVHPADTDRFSDVFVRDLTTDTTEIASVSSSRVKGNGTSYQISLAANGSAVAFRSDSTNLDPRDPDSVPDVYVKELGGPPPSSEVFADLSVRQTPVPDPVPAGQDRTYDIEVANAGPVTATGVTLLDELPDRVTFRSATASQGGGCSVSDGIVGCDLGTLAPGATARAAVVVAPETGGNRVNTVTVQANETDPAAFDNRSRITTKVGTGHDLAVSVSDAPDPVRVRQPLTYTISIENRGPTSAFFKLVDTLPSGVRVEAVAAGDERCQISRDNVTCTIGLLEGETATIDLTVSARQPGTLTNRVEAGPHGSEFFDFFDPDLSNNTASATTTVIR